MIETMIMTDRHLQVVLILEGKFPFRHRKHGKPTNFKEAFMDGSKKHTIRSSAERWEHNIRKVEQGKFVLAVSEWSGMPHRSKEKLIKELKTAGIQHIKMFYDRTAGIITKAVIDGKEFADIDMLARNEGMTLADFTDWFFGQGMTRDMFEGCIIHFDPKTRYRGIIGGI